MSPETERIPIPTNGRGPHPTPAPASPTDAAERLATSVPSPAELSVAFTPKQIAVGFGIIASLLLLLAGLARRRGSGHRD